MNNSSSLQTGMCQHAYYISNVLILGPSLCSRPRKKIQCTEFTWWACSLATLEYGDRGPVVLSSNVGGGYQKFSCIKKSGYGQNGKWILDSQEIMAIHQSKSDICTRNNGQEEAKSHFLVAEAWVPNCNTDNSSGSTGPPGKPFFPNWCFSFQGLPLKYYHKLGGLK